MRAVADKNCVPAAHEKGTGSVKAGNRSVRSKIQWSGTAPLVSSSTASGGIRSTVQHVLRPGNVYGGGGAKNCWGRKFTDLILLYGAIQIRGFPVESTAENMLGKISAMVPVCL